MNRRGHDHGVDHVNYAVVAKAIRLYNIRVIDHHLATLGHNLDGAAFDGLGSFHLDHLRGHDFTGHYMVKQDAFEFFRVV